MGWELGCGGGVVCISPLSGLLEYTDRYDSICDLLFMVHYHLTGLGRCKLSTENACERPDSILR